MPERERERGDGGEEFSIWVVVVVYLLVFV